MTGFLFLFKFVERDDISNKIRSLNATKSEIKQLDTRKACQDTDVPSKIVKMNSDIFADFLHQDFNGNIATSVFPQNLKNANITPLFKKGDRNSETNYRRINILPNVSKNL